MKLYISKNYKANLNKRETQIAVKTIRDLFQKIIELDMGLERISAPLFVKNNSGLNDNLSGAETPVNFTSKDIGTNTIEIVHSLAKWKRAALKKYNFAPYEGLYTNMNAIRKDEELDNIHSLYVDQWDWERIITKKDRCQEYLMKEVKTIYRCIKNVAGYLERNYGKSIYKLPKDITYVTTQELLDTYPHLNAKERENAACKKYGAIFLSQIGKILSNDEAHDTRSPDYDDWDLNGDILVWYEPLDCALELSSMGIRVDAESLNKQLSISNTQDRKNLPYHKAILNNELPLTIGGGIGQSRLCMLLLQKIHIGEVQASIWPKKMIKDCKEHNIDLL